MATSTIVYQQQYGPYQGGGTVTPPPAQKRMAVAMLDSITYGYQLPDRDTQAWPVIFANRAQSVYGLVINKGVSGDTVEGAINRLADITASYNFVDYEGVDVFVLGGSNDAGRTYELSKVYADYQTLFTGLRQPNPAKVRIYQLTLPAALWPYGGGVTTDEFTAKVNDINATIRANAKAWGAVDVIDLARRVELQDPTNPTYYQEDHAHPAPGGAAVIGNTAADYKLSGIQPDGPILSNPPAGEQPIRGVMTFVYDDARIKYVSQSQNDPVGPDDTYQWTKQGDGYYRYPGHEASYSWLIGEANLDVYVPLAGAPIRMDIKDATSGQALGQLYTSGAGSGEIIVIKLTGLIVGHRIVFATVPASGDFGYSYKFYQY